MNLSDRKKILKKIDIYPVITTEFCGGRLATDVLKEVLDGGAKIVQLREKEILDKDYYKLASDFRSLTTQYKALLIINDRIDIAMDIGADGVHLGQNDLSIDTARSITSDILIGASTHNLEQALEAEKNGADYINYGPIFKTRTKASVKPVGLKEIKVLSKKIKIPFTVMGGIKLDNVNLVLKAGARKIAVITALTRSKDIKADTIAFINKIKKYK